MASTKAMGMAGLCRTRRGTVRVRNDYLIITKNAAFAQQQAAIALVQHQQQMAHQLQQQMAMSYYQQMAMAYSYHLHQQQMAESADDDDEAMRCNFVDDDNNDAADDDDEVPALGAMLRHNMVLRSSSQQLPPNYGKRHHMILNLMKEGSDHSHRMSKKNKPKHYLPRRDVRHTEEMLLFKCDTPYWYNATDLGSNPHCSVPDAMVDKVIEDYEANGIPHTTVDYSSQGADGMARSHRFGFTIAYQTSQLLRTIEQNASGFEDELLEHLLHMHRRGLTTKDETRMMTLFRDELNEEKTMERIRGGWGQGQPSWSPAYREHEEIMIPSLKCEGLKTMSRALRKKLYWVFHLVAEMVKKEHPGAFWDEMRQKIFGGMMREELGCDDDDPVFPWEYFDVLVTCDTALSRHCDHLNDWRKGYNHTSVYSYHRTVEGAEYKVSIIMTTRRSVGRAMERIREGLNL